jgi:hypothetical protein
MTKREARVIMPTSEHYTNAWLREQLTKTFGGCTETKGFGNWVDASGKVVSENVTIYDVAMTGNFQDWHILRGFARQAAIMANQDCVYVRNAQGEVFLVRQENWSVRE